MKHRATKRKSVFTMLASAAQAQLTGGDGPADENIRQSVNCTTTGPNSSHSTSHSESEDSDSDLNRSTTTTATPDRPADYPANGQSRPSSIHEPIVYLYSDSDDDVLVLNGHVIRPIDDLEETTKKSSQPKRDTSTAAQGQKRSHSEMRTPCVEEEEEGPKSDHRSFPRRTSLVEESVNNLAWANRKDNIITLSRNCPMEGCERKFVQKETLLSHLASAHQVHHFRCHMLGCGASFSSQAQLIGHRQAEHRAVRTYYCPYCRKPYRSYEPMVKHIYVEHALGEYACAFAGCTYRATTRSKISNHFDRCHRIYRCHYRGCNRDFPFSGHLHTHEFTHLQVKPFSCTWPQCGFISDNKSHVFQHVRVRHFRQPSTKRERQALGLAESKDDPKSYVRVDEELIAYARRQIALWRDS